MASDISETLHSSAADKIGLLVRFGDTEPTDEQVEYHLHPGGRVYEEMQRQGIIPRGMPIAVFWSDRYGLEGQMIMCDFEARVKLIQIQRPTATDGKFRIKYIVEKNSPTLQ